jgi:hypothetical protein
VLEPLPAIATAGDLLMEAEHAWIAALGTTDEAHGYNIAPTAVALPRVLPSTPRPRRGSPWPSACVGGGALPPGQPATLLSVIGWISVKALFSYPLRPNFDCRAFSLPPRSE